MELFALTEDFELVTADIPYFNLQWQRRYYQPGQFSMQISADVFDKSWRYICTHDRPEVGVVQKVQYEDKRGKKLVQVSGFFAEQRLNGLVVFPRFTKDLSKTESVIKALVESVPLLTQKGIAFTYDPDKLLGDRTQCDFIGEPLGNKCYSILETRELSYKVFTDYNFRKLYMEVWQGLDRTQSQSKNAWAVFATTWGNIENERVNLDDSAYANVCRVSAADETLQFDVDLSNGGERYEIFLDKNSETKPDDITLEEFRAALEQEALEKLADAVKVIDIDVDNFGAVGYRHDFDLGDKVTVNLEDIGLSLETRIVEVNEVFKDSGHTVQLGFGTKRISNIRRATQK